MVFLAGVHAIFLPKLMHGAKNLIYRQTFIFPKRFTATVAVVLNSDFGERLPIGGIRRME